MRRYYSGPRRPTMGRRFGIAGAGTAASGIIAMRAPPVIIYYRTVYSAAVLAFIGS